VSSDYSSLLTVMWWIIAEKLALSVDLILLFGGGRAGSKKESRGSEQLVLDAVRSGMQFQKFIADAALKVWQTEMHRKFVDITVN